MLQIICILAFVLNAAIAFPIPMNIPLRAVHAGRSGRFGSVLSPLSAVKASISSLGEMELHPDDFDGTFHVTSNSSAPVLYTVNGVKMTKEEITQAIMTSGHNLLCRTKADGTVVRDLCLSTYDEGFLEVLDSAARYKSVHSSTLYWPVDTESIRDCPRIFGRVFKEPIRDFIGVGREFVDIGKNAVDVGKNAVDVGKNFVNAFRIIAICYVLLGIASYLKM